MSSSRLSCSPLVCSCRNARAAETADLALSAFDTCSHIYSVRRPSVCPQGLGVEAQGFGICRDGRLGRLQNLHSTPIDLSCTECVG